ncbi:MAG: extracellular solute-binding protein [Planctomycetaceae bacterium]|nr:extracellular solute-binding protein [Planctomycetaceae bacterium]
MKTNRRGFLKTLAATAPLTRAPYAFARQRRVLRVLGTHVTLQEPIREAAQRDLGIEVQFEPGGSARVLHQAATRPTSFDLYEQWSNSIRILWQAGTIQPIDTRRLNYWHEINPLTTTGRLTRQARVGAGDAPNRLLFVQDNGRIGSDPTERISFLPYVHNVDSFGYDVAQIPRGVPYETESWAWLLDRRWSGRVALVNEPTIGLFDAVLAIQAAGLAEFEDIGNLNRHEVNLLFQILTDLRRDGHFRGAWNSVPHSVELMARGEAVIESMFSPAVFALKGRNINCAYASPKEGYRAWHGVMCLSAAADRTQQEIAYEYMNWWLSGWPGAFIARQGYYISNPQRSRSHLSQEEWDYWYEGRPAATDLQGTDGRIVVQQGEVRDGGSYLQRFSNIAVWNTVMETYEYTLPAWNEFLSITPSRARLPRSAATSGRKRT